MIELEKTYLAKEIPEGLKDCKSKEIIDVYIPKEREHARLRLRKNGDTIELTKKTQVNEGDASHLIEETIILDEKEFQALNQIEGRRIHKIRYYYLFEGRTAEIDVFQDDLEGFVLVDFEFQSVEEKDAFQMPNFCLADVTQEDFVAGGILCGKSYTDIENNLNKFGYKKLSLN